MTKMPCTNLVQVGVQSTESGGVWCTAKVLFLAYGNRRLEVLSGAGFDSVCHQAIPKKATYNFIKQRNKNQTT